MNEIFTLATSVALTSPHTKHKHSSLLIKDGQVLLSATNSDVGGFHSEENLIQMMSRHGLKADTVVNVRVNTKTPDTLRLSKPCMPCYLQLLQAGIKTLYYSTEDGYFIRTELSPKLLWEHKLHSHTRLARALMEGPTCRDIQLSLNRGPFGGNHVVAAA